MVDRLPGPTYVRASRGPLATTPPARSTPERKLPGICFGNYKGRAVARRRYAVMFPDFLDLHVDELQVEMANREFAELELTAEVAKRMDVGVGIVDVKNYYVETADDIEERIRACLTHVPPDRLSVSPDCGLSQTARWAAFAKLSALAEGALRVRAAL